MKLRCLFAILASVVVVSFTHADSTRDPTPSTVPVEGAYLKAFLVAHDDFVAMNDLPADKKDLQQYTIYFCRNHSRIDVVFLPKLPPGWFGTGGETPYGREVHYQIDERKYKIIRRTFGE